MRDINARLRAGLHLYRIVSEAVSGVFSKHADSCGISPLLWSDKVIQDDSIFEDFYRPFDYCLDKQLDIEKPLYAGEMPVQRKNDAPVFVCHHSNIAVNDAHCNALFFH